jgi:hypothetical protein
MKLLETPMRNLREKEQMSFHRDEAVVRMQGMNGSSASGLHVARIENPVERPAATSSLTMAARG